MTKICKLHEVHQGGIIKNKNNFLAEKFQNIIYIFLKIYHKIEKKIIKITEFFGMVLTRIYTYGLGFNQKYNQM
jgi:hypothetical protein